MPSLHEVQEQFTAAITATHGPMSRVDDRYFPTDAAIAVYRNNLIGNLGDALRSVYASVDALVGHEFFDHLAAAYATQEPSHTGNLNDYGAGFAGFVAAFPGLEGLPYAEDVARLDWACHEALLAPDHSGLDLSSLARIDELRYADLRFALHPAARLIASDYPLFRIWKMCQAPDEAGILNLDAGVEWLLISRPGMTVELEGLSPGEFILLQGMSCGLRFGPASERAIAADGRLDLVASLQRLVLNRIIVAWALDPLESKQEGMV